MQGATPAPACCVLSPAPGPAPLAVLRWIHQLLGGESRTKERLKDLRGVKRVNQGGESWCCEEEELLWAVCCAGAQHGAARAHIFTRLHVSESPQTISGVFTLARTHISSLFVKLCNGKRGPTFCYMHMWEVGHPASKSADFLNNFGPWSPFLELPSNGFE